MDEYPNTLLEALEQLYIELDEAQGYGNPEYSLGYSTASKNASRLLAAILDDYHIDSFSYPL